MNTMNSFMIWIEESKAVGPVDIKRSHSLSLDGVLSEMKARFIVAAIYPWIRTFHGCPFSCGLGHLMDAHQMVWVHWGHNTPKISTELIKTHNSHKSFHCSQQVKCPYVWSKFLYACKMSESNESIFIFGIYGTYWYACFVP